MNLKPIRWLFSLGLFAIALGSASIILAQDQPAPEASMENDRAQSQESPEMREMARAMKSMADMCQAMMAGGKASRPYAMAAAGVLLVIALALVIVLELQLIRFLNLRGKSEQ